MKYRFSMKRRMAAMTIALPVVAAANGARAGEWKQYAEVEQAGWSRSKLEEARRFAVQIGSGAVLIVDHGNVIAAWGAIDHPFKMASVRKSIYDATIGMTHKIKAFDVNTSIGALSIDDLEPLSKEERQATFEQLLEARSGVYHSCAYETESNAARRPERGSAKPGANWYYNNWDFNVLCAVFEKLSGESMHTAIETRLAGPLGMEDFQASHLFDWLEPRSSRYPALTIRMSARDLARVGKLFLQDGQWDGRQLLAAEWVEESTRPHTTFESGHYRGEGNGYGRLWWIFPARPQRGSAYETHHRVAALGKGGQIMVLFPEIDVIVVHLADTDGGRGVGDSDGIALLDRIMAAREERPAPEPSLRAVQVQSLGHAPNPIHDSLTKIPEEKLKALVGRFEDPQGGGIRLYEYDRRLFAQPLGVSLPDVELFLATDGSLQSPLIPLTMKTAAGTGGLVAELRVTFSGRTQVSRRVE